MKSKNQPHMRRRRTLYTFLHNERKAPLISAICLTDTSKEGRCQAPSPFFESYGSSVFFRAGFLVGSFAKNAVFSIAGI